MNARRTTSGFTLIELLVVISIVALISSVAMYSTAQARVKADDAKKRSEVRQVETAIAIKKSSTNRVPRNYNCAGTYCSGGVGTAIATEGTQAFNASMQELVNEGYISAIPNSKDDSYVYFADSGATSGVFGAELKSEKATFSSRSYCPAVPDPYLDCKMTTGTQSMPNPYYSGSDVVNFYIPGPPQPFDFYYTPPAQNQVTEFCKIYGDPLCNPGATGSHVGQGCPAATLNGFTGTYGCLFQTYYVVLSCKLKPGAISTCSGAKGDVCSCVE